MKAPTQRTIPPAVWKRTSNSDLISPSVAILWVFTSSDLFESRFDTNDRSLIIKLPTTTKATPIRKVKTFTANNRYFANAEIHWHIIKLFFDLIKSKTNLQENKIW